MAKLVDQFEAKYGYEFGTSNTGVVSKLLALYTKATSNEGIAFEMQALGIGGELVGEIKPPVSLLRRDLTG